MTKEELKQEAEKFARTEMSHPNEYGQYYCTFLKVAEPREKRIEELEAQVKKMRNCGNCKHFYTVEQGCSLGSKNYFCMLDKWELAE